jgi:hypothetical protein
MDDKNKDPKPQWKECIVFGVINVLLVLLCTKLKVTMISVALILLIAAGVVATIKTIKEDWQEGFKSSAIGCTFGLILHIVAAVLYVINVLGNILGVFNGNT